MKCRRTRKVAFRDEIAAKLAIVRRQANDQRRERTEVRTYRCSHCRRWHLTSMPKVAA